MLANRILDHLDAAWSYAFEEAGHRELARALERYRSGIDVSDAMKEQIAYQAFITLLHGGE